MMKDSYKKFRITDAEEIYVIGDGDAIGRDGKTLQALDAVSRVAAGEMKHDVLALDEVKKDLNDKKQDLEKKKKERKSE